ncbi:hypothetical protein BJ878DRAFT_501967 [Calycina marina]|uniref:Uncharacterized protein n=1 Tax=Calycina marina TaxID=1763456 RepID=A0A9P7Z5P4_9HELO|nr:hypothetical protein BJ878DRAFT_501967 [Calycina marina]
MRAALASLPETHPASCPTSCPAINLTVLTPYCPGPLLQLHPRPCVQPACILLSALYSSCSCPAAIPTSTVYTACLITTTCRSTCQAATSIVDGCNNPMSMGSSCSSVSVSAGDATPPFTTKKPLGTGCVTVTDTTGSALPATTCLRADCIYLNTIMQSCGCNQIFHMTSCKTTCGGACSTQYQTLYLPCPTSPPTGSVGGWPVVTGGYQLMRG